MAASADSADLVVVGGGIAGLAAARRAALSGARVVVLEAGDRVGGMLRAATLGTGGGAGDNAPELVVDIGAEAFAVRGGAVERWLGELGLAGETVEPLARGSWGYADGEAYPLPKTGLLGIPAHAGAPDVRAALGVEGAARAAADAMLTPDVGSQAGSLAELARVRMGDLVVDRLVAPVARGVYSTDPALLDHRRIAPGLADAIATAGTLGLAVAGLRSAAPPGAAVRGFRGGMWRIVGALAEELSRLGADVRTGTRVASLRRLDHTWNIDLADGGRLRADAVLLTVDPAANGIDVDGLGVPTGDRVGTADQATAGAPIGDGGAESLRAGEPITPAEVVAVAVEAPELDAFPRGTGVLVGDPPGEVSAKALTHVTAKWDWLAERVPAGMHVLRLSYGSGLPRHVARRPRRTSSSAASDSAAAVFPARGAAGFGGGSGTFAGSGTARRASGADAREDAAPLTRGLGGDELADLALRDASELLDVPLERTRLRALARREWRIPYPAARIGRADELDALRDRAADLPAFGVAGTWIDGTGLATVVPAAERAAEALLGPSSEGPARETA
ncbi:hypothetical protein GCM10011490_18640 [Pseudoclavibacter endophyticus]|uniref:protoporphyrinogen/coproporphyrinogen oxidase n=1 Tax=Pseudoclavibacter endophyticus TaxID=1778590 RepID=UPI00166E65E5|nr:FAD-dependent oxidoreductase [Pseudoclavibacter endophyticus]GGA68453.1 hypothetical protein GCM10011490_18640 [Pseudoclavibacter endophyticus]